MVLLASFQVRKAHLEPFETILSIDFNNLKISYLNS